MDSNASNTSMSRPPISTSSSRSQSRDKGDDRHHPSRVKETRSIGRPLHAPRVMAGNRLPVTVTGLTCQFSSGGNVMTVVDLASAEEPADVAAGARTDVGQMYDLVTRLSVLYGADEATVGCIVESIANRYRQARITAFVPVLVEKEARDLLRRWRNAGDLSLAVVPS